MNCFECGQPATMQHHVVPQVLGGARTVPLCDRCHGLIHGVSFGHGSVDHAAVTRLGLHRARSSGVRLGRPSGVPPEIRERIASEHALGSTLTAIARRLNLDGCPTAQGGSRWYPSTVRAILHASVTPQ